MTTDSSQVSSFDADSFYIVEREPGHTQFDLPLWTATSPAAIGLAAPEGSPVERVDVPDVPGGFHLLNVLDGPSCDALVKLGEELGYHEDAPVSLPRSIRHNNNFNWVVDESIDGPIWERCKGFFETSTFSGLKPLGLNARFRFYRYGPGDFFDFHTDGAWPGSRVIDGELVNDAYGDRISEMTFLIFLSDGYVGGRTLFRTDHETTAAVATPKGAVLCFPHGMHPMHCVHSGEEIVSGYKYVIRTDVLYG